MARRSTTSRAANRSSRACAMPRARTSPCCATANRPKSMSPSNEPLVEPGSAAMSRTRTASFLLFALLAFAFAPAFAQQADPPAHAMTADGRHTLNLKDADIQALIATVSEITGKNFIVGPNVQGKVTVVSAE